MSTGTWKFHKRTERCGGCEKEFAEGEAHWSLLRIGAGELDREDLCRACFEGRAGLGSDRDADKNAEESAEDAAAADLVWWRTRHQADRKRGLQLDLESIESLFMTLEGRPEQHVRELRFLLALLLLRKRRLKVVQVRRVDGEEAFSLRRPRHGEELIVHVFDLTPERQAELKQALVALFDQPDPGALEDLAAQGLEPPAELGGARAGEEPPGSIGPGAPARETARETGGPADGA